MADLRDELQATLGESYRLERELTGGGMSRVFLARDEKLGRRIVIKMLTPELSATLSEERFQREIALAARLRHPNIVPLLDAGSSAAGLYYTMPYIVGESLRERLRRDGPLPLDEALRLTLEVAEALGYAHSENVVHRDIKPENILLDSGHAVVTDFGIARAVSQSDTRGLTMTGVAVGTPAYMSPEQFSARDVDGRSDLYSLGCVLFEMLTGRTMFAVGPFGTLDAGVATPPSVKEVLRKAMAEDPDARFGSAAEFGAALRAAMGSTAGWRRPTPRLVVGAAAIVIMTAVAAWQLRPARATISAAASGQPLLTATYDDVPLRELLLELGPLVDRSFIATPAAETVRVTTRIHGQPWDVALLALLNSRGLSGEEDSAGIIRIDTKAGFAAAVESEPLTTRIINLCWRSADRIAETIRPRVGAGGSVVVDAQVNNIALTARPSYMDALTQLVLRQDIRMSATQTPLSPNPQCRLAPIGKPPEMPRSP